MTMNIFTISSKFTFDGDNRGLGEREQGKGKGIRARAVAMCVCMFADVTIDSSHGIFPRPLTG